MPIHQPDDEDGPRLEDVLDTVRLMKANLNGVPEVVVNEARVIEPDLDDYEWRE